ncbi:MAG: D-alanyl-D-alanine carboxypeptidase/D-alanyl-D-alanine-endopeptidase [Candidatus Marinimicrobia bacterium]|nr:D-alanyl-D-alanine carboxypeptidase/D-alanyl-D-alanine-endopeptidase [Candidatus Neomarinimicrobiota bacterium]
MKNIGKTSVVLLFTVILFSCSSLKYLEIVNNNALGTSPKYVSNHSIQSFRSQVNNIVNAPHFQTAIIGIHIEDYRTQEIVYSLNPHTLLMPASNMKLFTTTSALALLGPDYRYKTSLFMDGKIENGVLNGNLIVKGSGDPTISGRYNGGNRLELFQNWADTLKSLGIREINGTIIGDDDLFDDNGLGYSWAWDDLSYYYAAKVSALSFNDNCVDLFIVPNDSVGGEPRLFTEPEMNYLNVINELVTVPVDSSTRYDFYRTPGLESVRIFGTIKAGSDTIKDWITVDNPTKYTLSAFQYSLKENGITALNISDIDELPLLNPDYTNYTKIASHSSIPLSDIIRTINKVSQNFYAEQLQKTLGVEFFNEGSSKKGIDAEKQWFTQIGLNPDDIFIVDGSGLSRHNLVTVNQIVTILRGIRNDPNYQIFYDSLPIGGVDGTIKGRLKGSDATGHVFAKTGYVGRVRALSGFVKAKNGHEYIFSILINHYPVPTSLVNNMQDQIVTLLYNLDY